jgi:hypothetical protein
MSHSEAVSHDVAKEAAEHEHLTMFCISCKMHGLRFMLLVCFSYSFQWGFLCYSTGGTSGLVSSFV